MNDHVFICYSRKDEDFVLKLAANLKREGIPIWLDQWDIPTGANWNRTIEKALNECTRLLVVISPSSIDSDEVQSEWLSALDEKKIVVPILYQPCRIPFRLKPIQYIDFTLRSLDDERSLEQILNALGMTKSIQDMSLVQQERESEVEEKIRYYKGFAVKSKSDKQTSNAVEMAKSILNMSLVQQERESEEEEKIRYYKGFAVKSKNDKQTSNAVEMEKSILDMSLVQQERESEEEEKIRYYKGFAVKSKSHATAPKVEKLTESEPDTKNRASDTTKVDR
jgi:hypothetical protein